MIHDHDHHNLPPHQSDEPLNQGHQPLLGKPVTVSKTQDSPGWEKFLDLREPEFELGAE